MNVLFHTYWYPYKGSVDGVFIKEHVNSCKTVGGNVAVQALKILPGKGLFSVKNEFLIDETGTPTYYLVVRSVFWKLIYVSMPLLYWLAKKHYSKHIKKYFLPDVVVSNVINPGGITGYWLANFIGCKHIIIEHWTRIPKFMRVNIFASVGKKAYAKADAIVAVSSFLKNQVVGFGADKSKAFIVPNVVDATDFYYQPKSRDEAINFCFIAGLKYPKDPFLIIKALGIIADKTGKKIVLNIIGAGPYKQELVKLASNYNYTINFLGQLPKPALASELRKADYLVHASYLETFSLVIAEAICTGTPVCASDIPPLDDLVNDRTGILCNNTVEDWVSGVEKLMATDYNLEQVSVEYRTKFSKETVGKQLLAVFEKATKA